MDTTTVTIIYTEGSEEVVHCYGTGSSDVMLYLYNEQDQPVKMYNLNNIQSVHIEYPEDGLQISFEPDLDREIH